jgi:HAD superfamily hydrolase (TIGR01509 family)
LLPKTGAVLFDVDDTLYDRKTAQRQLLSAIIADLPSLFPGVGWDAAYRAFLDSDRRVSARLDLRESIEGPRLERWRVFLELLGLDPSKASMVNDVYMDSYSQVCPPVPHAVQCVRTLAASVPLGVVSNGFVDIQYRKLEALGIRHLFSCIVLSDELGIRKPDVRIFQEAIRLIGLEPKECLYVGDSYTYDIVGAAAAGMRTCWFRRLEGAAAEEGHPSDGPVPGIIIESLDELADAIGLEPGPG